MRCSCSGVHLSNTGSRISNGTPPVSWSTEKRFPAPKYTSTTNQSLVCVWGGGLPGLYSQLMLFWSVRIHCWYKLSIAGRKTVLAPEYTCIFLLSRWPLKTADSSGVSEKSGSFSTLKPKADEELNSKSEKYTCSCWTRHTFPFKVVKTGGLITFRQSSR